MTNDIFFWSMVVNRMDNGWTAQKHDAPRLLLLAEA